ncbi:ankyrin repeat domain-containing protein [Endozoicomonas sp. ISHI1]|uniref:ankyrin repeat domain-containing protein n=1 Tax=Endozoicomonas sp. ISHI1 TaxID=2825882 RepID=UPI0021493804|nr:ankyrin repeat domain-containing protein [Endozoicomonas sp. ISHI1]
MTSISDIAHAHGYAESDLPSDEKQGRLNGRQLTTTIIESISWPWLYANHLLVDYELILTSKNTPLSSTSYSWLPAKMVVAVGWLLKSYFYIYISSFNSIAQKELCQVHPLAAIITMPGSGSDQPQHPPSESSGQQAQGATACPAGSFNSFLYSDSAGGSGGSQQHQHTLGLDCFVSPCHGVCQFRPSSDSSGPAEWQMDSIARRAVPTDTDVTMESDPCPICLDHFHGRDEAPVVVKSQCCDQRFDLNCISKCFVEQPIGYRRCAMCRQDPMPMVDENTSESHPDKFFPDQAFYLACFQGDLDQVEKSLAEGVNVNVGIYDDFTALILASCKGHKDVAKRLIDAGVNINARTKYGATALYMAAHENNSDCVKILIEAKADLNARSKNGATPLYIAAREGHTDIVKLLIEAGADLNAALPNGASPLFIAARKGHTDIVKLLIEAGAELNAAHHPALYHS